MPKVTFVNEKRELEVPQGANLRQEARKAGIELYQGADRYFNCLGNGMCGTCGVLIKKGMENVSAKGAIERFKLATSLASIGVESELRLSCQIQVNGDCSVETQPGFNWSGESDRKGKHFWETPYPNK